MFKMAKHSDRETIFEQKHNKIPHHWWVKLSLMFMSPSCGCVINDVTVF